MSARAKRQAAGLACALLLFAPLGLADHAGDAPVDFTLQQLGGGEISLSDYRGEWVVVNYWATWCPPCRKEMPELSELHEARGDVTVLGLAYEEGDMLWGNLEFIHAFAAEDAVRSELEEGGLPALWIRTERTSIRGGAVCRKGPDMRPGPHTGKEAG